MEYLTTHDIIWINTSVTGTPQGFDYVTLESVMAGQYSYGESNDAPLQAAAMLQRLLAKKPFSAGNKRTAFIATLTFLNANGYATIVADTVAAQLIDEVASGERPPADAINVLTAPAQGGFPGNVTLRRLITHECNLHVEALKTLTHND